MKLKLWPKDATSIAEKVLWIAMYLGMPGLYLMMQLIALGFIWQSSDYAGLVQSAPASAHVLGFVLSVATVGWFLATAMQMNFVSKNNTKNQIYLFIGAVLSIWAYAGFQS